MRRAWPLVFAVTFPMFVAACTTTSNDDPTAGSTSVAESTGPGTSTVAGSSSGDESEGSTVATTAADSTSSSTTAGSTGSTSGATTTDDGVLTFDDVSPIYNQRCVPCHVTGMLGGHNIGAQAVATGYADSQLDATSQPCAGLSKGACTIVRVQSGSMPMGFGCTGDPAIDADSPGCLTQEEQDLIQAWIDAGQPGPS